MERAVTAKRRKTIGEGRLIEEERYLCLGSQKELLCIDLRATEELYGTTRCRFLVQGEKPPEAVINCKVDLGEHGFLTGMQSSDFRFNTQSIDSDPELYLIGGEGMVHTQNPFFNPKIFRVVSEVSGGKVVRLAIEEAESSIAPRMRSGKGKPVVEVIGGKLYVLHTRALYASILLPEETFEVFDPESHQWKPLPPPPIFEKEYHRDFIDIIIGHSVFGQRIFIFTLKYRLISYDTITNKWSVYPLSYKDVRDFLPMTVLDIPTHFPNDLVIGINLWQSAALLCNYDGEVISIQSLPQIFDGMLPPERYYHETGMTLIPLPTRDGEGKGVIRMCACACISLENDDPSSHMLLVSIFSVQMNLTSQRRIFQMLKGEQPNFHDDPAYTNFLHVRVEKGFALKVPGVEFQFYHLNGPTFFL